MGVGVKNCQKLRDVIYGRPPSSSYDFFSLHLLHANSPSIMIIAVAASPATGFLRFPPFYKKVRREWNKRCSFRQIEKKWFEEKLNKSASDLSS